VERANALGRARILAAPRGRASQMNAGAALATGDVLLFLHGDVELPADAPRRVAETLRKPDVVAGAFRTWTVVEPGRRRWLGPLLHLADVRSRYTRLPYGDQAIFVRSEAFRRAGGFPPQPLMEDVELSRRLSRMGRIRIVRSSARVSGRRFQARPIASAILMNVFPLLYRLGVPAATLARWYGNPR
jgi:cellulose synthase/poly-beta-1,6-N-acetylglucosamine synthase-like glycosyltransferase